MHPSAVTFSTLCFMALPTGAQVFPSGQFTIVSPDQAGGTSDIIARELAQRLSVAWKQPVVVENRPRADGAIGVNAVAKGPTDGHMLLAVASSALTPSTITALRFVPGCNSSSTCSSAQNSWNWSPAFDPRAPV